MSDAHDRLPTACTAPACSKAAVPNERLSLCTTHRWRHYRYGSTDLPARGCAACGQALTSPWGRYCRPCRDQARAANRRRHRARTALVACDVADCGKPRAKGLLCVTHTMRMERYGSLDDRERDVVCECGEAFRSSNPKARYHSRECAIRFGAKRGAAREHHRAQDRIKRLRPAILERDGNVCHICRATIDLALRFPHPLSLTIDHVFPVNAGGSHEMENLRPAHLTCNVRKSDDLPAWWERASA